MNSNIPKLNSKQIVGTLLILSIILSMSAFIKPIAADIPQGNNVSWQTQDSITQNSWDWTNQGWQFGPYPQFIILLANGTEITNDNYIPLNELFTVQIDIQKSIFTGNATLGQAGISWNTDLRSENGSLNGNANCNMIYIDNLQQGDWNQTNTWNINSNINNQTVTPIIGLPPVQQENGFYQFNSGLSSVTETALGWRIQIVGAFNSSAPIGPYWVNLQITDQFNNWMDVNSQVGQDTVSNNRQVAVGQAGFVYGGLQDYWTFEKLDMQNNPLMSISKGAKFKMQLNVTSSQFTNATIALNMPWNIEEDVNVTGWYQKVITEQGGWMYNESAGTYYWNSTAQVTRNEQVWGTHIEKRWISSSNNNHEVTVYNRMWNPVTNEDEITSQKMMVQDQLIMIYNQATQNFDLKQGYTYSSYDIESQQYIQYTVLNPINASNPASQFFTLSLPDSICYQNSINQFTVEFVGTFSNTTDYNQDQYYLQLNVFSSTGQIMANWQDTGPDDTQIIVDRPVAVTTILDAQGHPTTTQSMFVTGQNKEFIVQSKIYGGSEIYNSLDAVGVSFSSNFGTWDENQNSNSQVEIRLVKDLQNNQISSTAFNRTNINKYVYGAHQGWAYVNVTDWHTEYNSTTGNWDWIESPHLIWNQTTLNDWHWEYYRFNQTEYARDPTSQNVWIDTTTCYVDDRDPAFRMQSSYANLNSANVSLIDGIVTVNLGVTFKPNAPQGNYWFNMIFQNMTYGQDPSQGWGTHQITEWTSQPIYYINGLSGQTWMASSPSNPLYTVYNATKYQVKEAPYITVAGNDLLIKPQIQYDQARQQDWTQYLLTGPYDPSIGRETQYYELPNGTKIYINQAYQTIIRSLQLTTANAYEIVNGAATQLLNGTIIETYMNHAVPDYTRQIQDPQIGNILPYYYQQLNGTRVYLDSLFEDWGFNTTTNHWDRNTVAYNETDTTIIVQPAGQGVKIGNTTVLLREPGYWQTLPDGSGYYLVASNGTRITIQDPYSVPDNQRFATIDGNTYLIGWPTQYFKATYQDQTLLIPSNGDNDNYVQSFFYTDLGENDGTQFELPYPGAMATSWWDLQGTESQGQKLKTLKTITISSSDYQLNFDSDTQTYYINFDGVRQTVTYPTIDYNTFYSTINGQNYWNITQNGWTLNYGTYNQQSGQLTVLGSIATTTGYDSIQQSWTANRYGYDYENSTLYLTMPNGTRLNIGSTMNMVVWRVQIGDQTYYTTDSYANIESTIDNSGQAIFSNYFKTLNNEKIYFDWTVPATWEQEIHIPITGINYTRLIPYTLQPQTVFDKVIIYNITIPELTLQPAHTGVYFGNGTEVPVGTPFKVIGSVYGPGTCYSFFQNGDNYTFDGAYLPNIKAPWNSSLDINYLITVEGERIYSPSAFGWNGNIESDPWNIEKQWELNGNQASANQTVSVIQGGYTVYLNDTNRVDVTTSNICGGGSNNYLVLTNGTRIDVQWTPFRNQWSTNIGNNIYFFNNVLSYSNLTDNGNVYNIIDPTVFDQRHLYTPSTYQTPTISTDVGAWLWMNATSESTLKDSTGYYLVNSSSYTRLDMQLVDDWWNVPLTLRTQVFSNQLSNYYPRFNITINGVDYFVLDPSPVTDNWNGEWSTQQALYRYPDEVNVTLGDGTFTLKLKDNGYWNNNYTIRQINTIELNHQVYDIDDQFNWKPSYQVPMNDEIIPLQIDTMNIYQTHQSQGNIFTWRLTDLGIQTTSNVNSIIVGTPQYGLWGIKAYKTIAATGAVDIDGDTTTSNDQYFVRKVHSGTDAQTQTEKRMQVDTTWNPDITKVGDEIHLNAWMGQLQVTWSSQWSEEYIWYHAADMSPVSNQEMAQINNIIVNNVTQQPNPGYWDIAYMVRNQTWADVLAEAEANNWDWIKSNTNEWNWLWFGTDQNYIANVISGNDTANAGVDLKYEFAGLNLLNGTSQTHYFMPKSVGNITFVTPGQAYGDMNASGSILLPLDAKIDFGVAYNNVNGTLFPYDGQRSMWGWWDRPIYGSDFNAPNLNNRPTDAAIDQLKFDVHFAGTQTEGTFNSASMKIDQTVGNWNLPSDVVDGRSQNSSGVMVPLMGNEVLQNRSLAINYYVTASTSMGWNVKDASGLNVNNNGVTSSSRFDVASQLAGVTFASIKLGSIYNWGKPISATDDLRTFNVTSQTTSIQNFQSSYQSDAGKSSTGYEISSSMYFLTQGFPKWDGYSIYNDPEVSVMVSKGTEQVSPPPSTNQPPPPTTQPTSTSTGQTTSTESPNSTTKPSNDGTPLDTAKPTPPAMPTPTTAPNKTTSPSGTGAPNVTILIVILVGIVAAVGSMMLVRMKKKSK